MSRDNKDEFIKEHYQSMSMQEMGDHLGMAKSTVSRRVARLRESGEIDEAIAESMKQATQRARDGVEGCTISDLDRLAKLDELRERLEAEFSTTGGANLARVSSEYRRTLEEMAAISSNLELVSVKGREVDIVTAIDLLDDVADQFPEVERSVARDIAEAALVYLDSVDIVSFTTLSRVTARVTMAKNKGKDSIASEAS